MFIPWKRAAFRRAASNSRMARLERRNALRLLRPTGYEVASPKDAEALHDEGIELSPLPVLPDERN
jgi:hypothetical protein